MPFFYFLFRLTVDDTSIEHCEFNVCVTDLIDGNGKQNGWFHMGDVMRRNDDDSLDYVDRVKYMIKSGGENIYPAEIEQVILADSRITEAVVVRKKDPKWSEVPVAFVVSSEKNIKVADILDRCKKDLSSYKQPKDIIFIDEADLPRSSTGKIQRHELEARL